MEGPVSPGRVRCSVNHTTSFVDPAVSNPGSPRTGDRCQRQCRRGLPLYTVHTYIYIYIYIIYIYYRLCVYAHTFSIGSVVLSFTPITHVMHQSRLHSATLPTMIDTAVHHSNTRTHALKHTRTPRDPHTHTCTLTHSYFQWTPGVG